MNHPLIIGLDLGTTGCRTIIFDLRGHEVATSYIEYEVETPAPGWAEQDADGWWQAAVRTLREAIAAVELRPGDVAAIGVTGQQPSPVFVDRDGHALAPSLIWMDQRTVFECAEIAELLGANHVYHITGLRIDAMYTATKILWVRRHWPDVFDRTHSVLSAKDFLLQRLTGQFLTDYATSGASMLFDIHKLDWSEEMLQALQIPRSMLPRARSSTDLAGTLQREVADEVGLLPGTPVYTCAGDTTASAIG